MFNFYLHDFPEVPTIKTALYADDAALYCSSHHAQAAIQLLQRHTNNVINNYNKWKLRVNVPKCEIINFNKKVIGNKIITPPPTGA